MVSNVEERARTRYGRGDQINLRQAKDVEPSRDGNREQRQRADEIGGNQDRPSPRAIDETPEPRLARRPPAPAMAASKPRAVGDAAMVRTAIIGNPSRVIRAPNAETLWAPQKWRKSRSRRSD